MEIARGHAETFSTVLINLALYMPHAHSREKFAICSSERAAESLWTPSVPSYRVSFHSVPVRSVP